MKIVRLPQGARLIDGGDVLSEIRATRGPTDTFFDLLAVSAVTLTPGPRLLILGFAGGGVIAPVRALGFTGPLETVDISRNGLSLFHELCGDWAGTVRFHHAEATSWLRRRRAGVDLILEDLSIPGPAGLTKPPVTVEVLPRLMRDRLRPGGVALTNLLPVPGLTWKELRRRLSTPWRHSLVLRSIEYENQLLITGQRLGTASEVSRRLRAGLRAIGSLQAERFSVRTIK